ncbi:hypothetical protein [Clostridium sp. E02]|uniref:hypothetical protein n=1 Tax=Clostridium sp. E02 TaxID=2487134 RepID=UPI000F5453E1|nr:hypothetical protein [Clostridium sp. E02]
MIWKNEKKIKIIFWVVFITCSAALGAMTEAFDMSPSKKTALILIWLSLGASFSVWILFWSYFKLQQKINSLKPILLEENGIDRYILEIQTLLSVKHSTSIVDLLKITLSQAYCGKKEYTLAKGVLLEVTPRKLARINQTVYWANLAYIYFQLQEDTYANRIMEKQKRSFVKQSTNPRLAKLISILWIFQAISNHDKDKARLLLQQSSKKWENDSNQSDFEMLKSLCD